MPSWLLYGHHHVQAIKRGFNQLSLSTFTTLMTFIVIGFVLALPLGLYVLLENVQDIGKGIHESAQISLFLDWDTTSAQVDDLIRNLKLDPDITKVIYISPQEGLKEFQAQYGFGNVLAELKNNPLPPTVIVEPVSSIRSQTSVQPLLNRLENLPKVHIAQLNMVWLQRLNAILFLFHRLFYAIAVIFSLGVLLIIGNTIKLIIQNFSEEMVIIKLLGGTHRYIRRPFLYCGIIYGVVGSIVAWLLVDITVWWMQTPINQLMNLYNAEFHFRGVGIQSTLVLLGVGALLGYVGAWLTVNRLIAEIEPRQ